MANDEPRRNYEARMIGPRPALNDRSQVTKPSRDTISFWFENFVIRHSCFVIVSWSCRTTPDKRITQADIIYCKDSTFAHNYSSGKEESVPRPYCGRSSGRTRRA